MPPDPNAPAPETARAQAEALAPPANAAGPVTEQGGPAGPEPTRFGDWERKGRCIDF